MLLNWQYNSLPKRINGGLAICTLRCTYVHYVLLVHYNIATPEIGLIRIRSSPEVT